MNNIKLKNCPFCGHDMHDSYDLLDYVYMIESWMETWNNGYPHLEKLKTGNPDADYHIWHVYCNESAGGCGASAIGKGMDEAVANWNRRS